MKQKVSLFVLGLFVGLVVGFVVTNHLNRPEFAVGRDAAAASSPAGGAKGPAAPDPDAPDAADATGGQQQISDEELAHIKQQVDASPDKYQDNLMLGEYLLRMRHAPKDAIVYYERANKVKPEELKPLVGLGDANFDAAAPASGGETGFDSALLKRAGEYYDKALAIDPKDVNVRTDLGLSYFYRTPRDVDRAIAEYRKSLTYDPKHTITMRNLAAALIEKGNYDEAEATLAQLEAIEPSNEALPRLRANIEQARSGQKIPSH